MIVTDLSESTPNNVVRCPEGNFLALGAGSNRADPANPVQDAPVRQPQSGLRPLFRPLATQQHERPQRNRGLTAAAQAPDQSRRV